MAAVNSPPDDAALQQTNWGPQDDQVMGTPTHGNGPATNGASMPTDEHNPSQDTENSNGDFPPPRGSSVGAASANGASKAESYRGEKQVKPNKVYIGGLPENTREEDLQSCFGKIGKIVNIELKVGYGFVEFDSREAAEESVAKYHEGYFMGNKIRVELSHGGGRTAKYAGEPGACFRCGQQGHWARECPNQSQGNNNQRPRNYNDGPVVDRTPRDYPPRGMPPRDDYPPRYPPARDVRYDYPPPPPREYRRPPSPGPRDYRDYPAPPPARGREYDDYGRRGPPPPPVPERDRYGPLPPPAPPGDYARGRYGPPPPDSYRGYSGPPQPPAAGYDRYDRRAPPPSERYPPSYPPPPPAGGRGRSPPPRDYDRAIPPRDYPDYRGRPMTPPRYPPGDYPRTSAEPPYARARRRSISPVPANVRSPAHYDMYPANGYSGNVPPAARRDYPPAPPPRAGGRDIDPAPYRRP